MDIKTHAIVLRRTNYSEADRILSLLTPEGKISAIAKGVRREKSKLAGAIELFSVSRITLHRSQHSDLAILTSARLDTFYSHILTDYAALELAYEILRQVSKKSEQADNPDFFHITHQALQALDTTGATPLLAAWWRLNLLRTSGEPPNFYTDADGRKLSPDRTYTWDPTDQSFRESPTAADSTSLIKLLRLLVSSPLATAQKVQNTDHLLPEITKIIQLY